MIQIHGYGYQTQSDINWGIEQYKLKANGNFYEIDLRNCKTDDDLVFKFVEVFRGEASPPLEMIGNTVDSLSDVAFDYFYDSWRRYDTVVVRGWLHAMQIHPGASQVILDILQGRYLQSIKHKLEDVFDEEEEDTLESINILDELENGHKIYFFMY